MGQINSKWNMQHNIKTIFLRKLCNFSYDWFLNQSAYMGVMNLQSFKTHNLIKLKIYWEFLEFL